MQANYFVVVIFSSPVAILIDVIGAFKNKNNNI